MAQRIKDVEDKIPLTAHLEELRHRLIVSFIAVAVCFCGTYFFKEKIFKILMNPLLRVMGQGDKMIFTALHEAFFTYLKVSFLAALMIASPVILHQFWKFVAPGLYKKERLVLLPIVFLSTVFFVGGALFGYFVVFPYGFQFFLSFANQNIEALPSMKEYLSFSAKLLIGFGLVFELPLVLTFMARLGIVTPAFLKKNRKYAILIFFTGSALITPPDVVTQVLMSLPLMVLYEISILGAWLFSRKKKEDKKEEEDEEPEEQKEEKEVKSDEKQTETTEKESAESDLEKESGEDKSEKEEDE